uniref:Uncharacterized protein n=1 Tax=virus sp. ctML55 TaxID=2827627 RepID=A0A8S5RJI3_9VIRU|nr:MAG TPA: hypothetical protein [virus sp. ctML55]
MICLFGCTTFSVSDYVNLLGLEPKSSQRV